MLRTGPLYPASYAEGYAPVPGVSCYPLLWERMLWGHVPGLGPTGAYIRNIVPGRGAGVHPQTITNDINVQWIPWLAGRRWGQAMGSENDTANPAFNIAGSAAGNIFKPLPVPCTLFWAGRWKTGGPEDRAGFLVTTQDKTGAAGGYRRGTHFVIDTLTGAVKVEEHDGLGGFGAMYSQPGLTVENRPHSVCVRIWVAPFTEAPDDDNDIWIDGSLADIASRTAGGTVDDNLNLLSRLHAAGKITLSGSNMWTSAFYFWNRLLQPSEIALLHADPLAPVRLDLLALGVGEERTRSLGEIRSRKMEPDPPKRRSRVFKSSKKPPAPVPKIARIIKSPKHQQLERQHKQRMMAAHAQGPPGFGGVADASGVTIRRMQLRSTFHIVTPAVYRFYRSNTAPPLPSDTPYATNATLLGYSPASTFADGTWYLSVSYFNGVVDSGFLPIGPNGEPYRLLVISGAAQIGSPPNAPMDARLEVRAGGVIRVHARYVQESGSRATEWAVTYTIDGSTPGTPPAVAPTTTQTLATSAAEILELDLPAQAHGVIVKLRIQTRRNDGSWVYSTSSAVLTATADAQGPAAVISGDIYPGGVP